MTVYESVLTPGNFTLKGKWPHIYITSFYRKLPPDVFGGTSADAPAPRRVRLEFGALRTDTFVPTDNWPDPIGWSGFNLSSCSALGLLPGQMTVLLRLLAQAR